MSVATLVRETIAPPLTRTRIPAWEIIIRETGHHTPAPWNYVGKHHLNTLLQQD